MANEKTKGELINELKGKIKTLEKSLKERKDAENSLKENYEIFLSLTSSASDAIIMMDHEGKISFWNESAEKIFRYKKKDAVGKYLHGLIVMEDKREAFLKGFERFKQDGTGPLVGRLNEVNALRRDGETFPVELSLSSVKVKGEWHAIGIVRDISERKRLEEEIKKRFEETERLNKLMVGRELKMEDLRREIMRLREYREK